MKTGKKIINPTETYQNDSDENSYFPITFVKKTGNFGEKNCTQDKGSTHLQALSLIHYGITHVLTKYHLYIVLRK